jgi:hypothetical protein
MRPRTLLVLLIVVAALAAFIRFYERDLPSSDERAQRAKKVLDFKKDQVSRVRLIAGATTVVLERLPAPGSGAAGKPGGAKPAATKLPEALSVAGPAAAGEWRIAQPLAARADAAAVDRLLDSLANLEKTRTLDQAVPAEMGLDKPRGAVALTVAGRPEEMVLKIGATVPTTGQSIVAIAGQPQAYVVGDLLLPEVTKKPGDWRDRQMFHGDRDAIQRLAWTVGSGPRVVLAKRGDSFWLEAPGADRADRADREQVEKLLSDLTGLNADTFLDTPPAPPSPPRAVLEVIMAGQSQPFRVELGASRPASSGAPQPGAPETTGSLTEARIGPAWFETRSTLPETLARPPAGWRSPLLSSLEVHQVDSAVVRDDKGAVALTRSGTDWKRGGVTISYLPVSDLLFAVTEAKADRLLAPAEAAALGAGAGKPALAIELKGGQGGGSGGGSETLTLYPALAGSTHGVPARAAGRDTVLLLPESKLKDIRDRLDAVRAAKPLAAEKPIKK